MTDELGEYYGDGIEEQVASSIWRKDNKGWNKISPYYAGVEIVANNFIVRTPEESGYLTIDRENGWAELDEYGEPIISGLTTSRSIYLDNEANPISFMDYFDFKKITDLGFGLQFETDNGAFFVTYEGKAITDDVYDHFELLDGELGGYLYYEEDGSFNGDIQRLNYYPNK